METIDSNKLIASFMGGIFKNSSTFHALNSDKECWLPLHGICYHHSVESGTGKILQYHNSWNWLMPVVEKIEGIGASVIIGRFFCDIKYQNPLKEEDYFEIRIASGIKMNAINGAVVEFIQWYNANQK